MLLKFFLVFSFFCIDIESYTQTLIQNKISPLLNRSLISGTIEDSLDITLSLKSGFQKSFFKNPFRLINSYPRANIIVARVRSSEIVKVVKDDAVLFADILRTPKEEITTGAPDFTLNKIRLTQSRYPLYNGNGITVSIKERLLDTTDIDIKGRFINSGVAANTQTTHATIMATLLAGAGNSSPFAKGVAWDAMVTSSNFATLLPDPDSVYQRYKISVQNHSYGTAIENFYGNDAVAYDLSVRQNPSLVHVFSAGNLGTENSSSGIYKGLAGVANLTGSFKMAKNIITVGSTDSFNKVETRSSRGPAFDGRVKPDLVAYGEDGSSGAAAMVSGSAALVQHAFKIINRSLPSAALVKAILLNSADDIVLPHVDYISGYGSLNTYNAVTTVLNKSFFEGTVEKKQTKTVSFIVPPGIALLKVLVSWSDTAATVNSPKALVNDLNAVLVADNTGQNWLPWVLNFSSNIDSLLSPAMRKMDTLNNVEQITVENPAPGKYSILVEGANLISASQDFAIAYQMDTINHFLWSYPSSPDVLVAAEKNVLRWQTNITGKGIIEYSYDGSLWQKLTDSVNLDNQYFKWQTPDTIAVTLLRMKSLHTNTSFISDSFVISKPLEIEVGYNCTDSVLLTWNSLHIPQYILYNLGTKFLEPMRVSTDTFVVLPKAQFPSLYYSVAPFINNKPGLRSYTVNYTTQGVDCYFRSFYLQSQSTDHAVFTGVISTLLNVAEVSFQKFQNGQFITLRSLREPTSTSLSFTDSVLIQGVNTYRLQIRLINGLVINSNEVITYSFTNAGVIIYPNPVKAGTPINIITNGISGNRVEIYNATGAFIDMIKLRFTLTQVHSRGLSKGVYFFKIFSNEGKISTQKLIVY